MATTRHGVVRPIIGLSAFALLSCAAEIDATDAVYDPENEAEVGLVEQAVLGGASTDVFPGVGRINTPTGGCTGTLISSRVILTAAHCLGFSQTQSYLGKLTTPPTFPSSLNNGYSFTTYNGSPPAGQSAFQTRNLRRFYVLSTSYGTADLAVAELESEVSWSYAPSHPVATSKPANGAIIRGVGYGCTAGTFTGNPPPNDWINQTWSTSTSGKSLRQSTWKSATNNAAVNLGCPGDSGGPILDNNGRIVAVFSHGNGGGPSAPQGTDTYGQAVDHFATIDRIHAIYGSRQVCTSCPAAFLRTSSGQHFLQAPGGGGTTSVVNAHPTAVGSWETFRLVTFRQQDPWIALQSTSGRWVTAEGGGGSNVTAERNTIGAWEVFRIEAAGSGFTLKTTTPGKPTQYYLVAENGGGGAVNANRVAAGPWETFTTN